MQEYFINFQKNKPLKKQLILGLNLAIITMLRTLSSAGRAFA